MPGLLVVLLFSVTNGLGAFDRHTCYNDSLSEYYCCSNYHEVNGMCVECDVGFQSRQGNRCSACTFYHFGKGCAFECICKELQRCDSIRGCVDVDISTTYIPNEVTFIKIGTTVRKSDDLSKTELLMLFSGASSGIIVLLGLFGLFYCCNRHRKVGISKPEKVTDDMIPMETHHKKHEDTETDDTMYEIIDESKLHSMVIQPRQNLTLGRHGDLCSKTHYEDNRSSYLHPYNSLLKVPSDYHTYEKH